MGTTSYDIVAEKLQLIKEFPFILQKDKYGKYFWDTVLHPECKFIKRAKEPNGYESANQ